MMGAPDYEEAKNLDANLPVTFTIPVNLGLTTKFSMDAKKQIKVNTDCSPMTSGQTHTCQTLDMVEASETTPAPR